TTVSARGITRVFTATLTDKVGTLLPVSLTDGQKPALEEIFADLKATDRMYRLLQGDVGSGKTVVALMAMAAMAEAGAQSALMAPTELLASQHFRTIQPLADAASLGIVLLTGKMPAAQRRAALAGLADGSINSA